MRRQKDQPEQERSLIALLSTLTKQGRINWQDKSCPLSTNAFAAPYRGFVFQTEWLRDGRPQMWFHPIGQIRDQLLLDSYELIPLIKDIYNYILAKDLSDTAAKIFQQRGRKIPKGKFNKVIKALSVS